MTCMSKTLVAYFSATGTTKAVAEGLARVAGADLFEIEPEVPYARADLDWNNDNSRTSVEMRDPASRPAIKEADPQLADYDLVFLGFPIWWYTAPTLIKTFLEKHDFSGKTIVLFATSGTSGFGKTAESLKESVGKGTIIKEGMVYGGHPSDEALKALVQKSLTTN